MSVVLIKILVHLLLLLLHLSGFAVIQKKTGFQIHIYIGKTFKNYSLKPMYVYQIIFHKYNGKVTVNDLQRKHMSKI